MTFNDLILHIQNISLLGIAVSCFYCCSYYYFTDSIEKTVPLFNNILPVIGVHAMVDFFATKKIDLKIHHLCVIGLLFYNYTYKVHSKDSFTYFNSLLKTEISSIFYVLKYYLPKKKGIQITNNLLFFLTFLKYRIIDNYKEIIEPNSIFNLIIPNYSSDNICMTSIILFSIYGLYLLNLYWVLIIIKMLYKSIISIYKNINTDLLCHYICSYIHFINIPLAVFNYSRHTNDKYMYDVFGIYILSIFSFLYHYDIYRKLLEKKIESYENPDKTNIVLFINDSIAIHTRSFFTVITSYYYNNELLTVVCLSSIFHLFSLYNIIINIFNLLGIDDSYNKEIFYIIHNSISMLSITIDILLVFINSNIDVGIPFLLVNILIGLLFVVEPFYKLNFVGFHLLLLFQNYYLCSCNKMIQ